MAENLPLIALKDVSIERAGKLVWSEGTFDIERGTVTAIIGSNGAGKTTLIEMLLGLLKPTTGEIALQSKKIGYVPQNYHLSNAEAIRGIDLVDLSLAISSTQKGRIQRALQAVNAEDFAKKRFSELSGGQQQRIAIAAAIAEEPDILILDEPLSSLDIQSAREIVELVAKLNSDLGITVLIVAHDLGLLLPVLTGAIYLIDGHAHYSALDDAEHNDFSDLVEHLTTLKVGDHHL